jgi:hypothetical protein
MATKTAQQSFGSCCIMYTTYFNTPTMLDLGCLSEALANNLHMKHETL